MVRWFNQVKRYGYIDGGDGGEVLVCRGAIEGATFFTAGLRVTYVAVDGSGELRSEHVHLAEGVRMAE
ncbi:cold shock domain protein CspD [Streptomyces sp. NPDC059928]|uniref:cold shock domain protein CspD n=1 Tax=unclassified Streptomyces TaxID=2593676 RepID=UPI00365623CC